MNLCKRCKEYEFSEGACTCGLHRVFNPEVEDLEEAGVYYAKTAMEAAEKYADANNSEGEFMDCPTLLRVITPSGGNTVQLELEVTGSLEVVFNIE